MSRFGSKFLWELNIILRSCWIHRSKRLLDPCFLDAAKSFKLLGIPVFLFDVYLGYCNLLSSFNIKCKHLQINLFSDLFSSSRHDTSVIWKILTLLDGVLAELLGVEPDLVVVDRHESVFEVCRNLFVCFASDFFFSCVVAPIQFDPQQRSFCSVHVASDSHLWLVNALVLVPLLRYGVWYGLRDWHESTLFVFL